MLADKNKSLNDKLNDAAMSLADNILKAILPRSLTDELVEAMYQNLFYKTVALQAAQEGLKRLEESITVDECNLTLETKWGTVGWRNKYCQPRTEPKPETDYFKELKLPSGESVFFLIPELASVKEDLEGSVSGKATRFTSFYSVKLKLEDLTIPYSEPLLVSAGFDPSIRTQAQWRGKVTVKVNLSFNGAYFGRYRYNYTTTEALENQLSQMQADGYSTPPANAAFSESSQFSIEKETTFISAADNSTTMIAFPTGDAMNAVSIRIFQTKLELERYLQYNKSIGNIIGASKKTETITGYNSNLRKNTTSTTVRESIPTLYGYKLPEPPPAGEECDCMKCCPDVSNLEALLKLILKKIGSTHLPASVPASLIVENSAKIQLSSLAEYLAYSVKQTNAQIGYFPQKITIVDSDLTQEGNQEKSIKLPNLAESLAEILGILLTLETESNANLIATINAMIEAGSAKQTALLAADYSRANSEYLGYKGKLVEKRVGFSF